MSFVEVAQIPTSKHRPRFHFSTSNWLNDVIPIQDHDGRYHLFFDHNPRLPEWTANSVWGHASSLNLVDWQSHNTAIAPTPGGPDEGGIFTGCVVRDESSSLGYQYLAFYTGIPGQSQCLALSHDLETWHKWSGNPLIPAGSPAGFGECFRDPLVWRENGQWKMIIGSDLEDKSAGAVLLYQSDDALTWQLHGSIGEFAAQKTGVEAECPDLFWLGDQAVLLTSKEQTWWHIGAFEANRFERASWGVCDGGHFYAAKTLLDARNRRLLFGWVLEDRPHKAQLEAGWSGVLSLPRVVDVDEKNRLTFTPPDELQALRGRSWRFENLQLVADTPFFLPDVEGEHLEIKLWFEPEENLEVELWLRASPDGEERAVVPFCAGILGERVTQPDNGLLRPTGARLELADDEALELHVFLDNSIIETFANRRACSTSRTYPERADSRRVALLSPSKTRRVVAAEIWALDRV